MGPHLFNPSILKLIIALNLLVFVAWHAGGAEHLLFMQDHFLVSWKALQEGRWWTLLGSAFSHIMFLHFFLNMYVLWGFGGGVLYYLGGFRFVIFYLLAAVVASWGHSFLSFALLDKPQLPALGASGAVAGVVMLFSLMFPRRKIYILGLIPVPALVGVLIIVGLDVWGLSAQAQGHGLPIGHGAHLGGALCGLIAYLFLRREFNP